MNKKLSGLNASGVTAEAVPADPRTCKHFWIQTGKFGGLMILRCYNCRATAGLSGSDHL